MAPTIAPQIRSRRHHYVIDPLRFAAAFSVLIFHLSFYSWASNPGSTTAAALHGAASFSSTLPWTWFGWVGVEVFFVISGFVIANSAMGASPGAFLKNRALRLLPAAWICATITLLVRAAGGLDPLSALVPPYLSSLALWPGGPWVDGVYWSLIVELTFYVLIFLLALHRMSLLPVASWGLTLVSCFFLVATQLNLVGQIPGLWRIVDLATPLLIRHGALFAVGIWLWMLSERRLTLVGAAGLFLAVSASCLEIWIRGKSLEAGEASAAAGQPVALPIVIWLGLVALLLIATRWTAAFTPRSANVRTLLRVIGLATYPLYLVHNVVGATLIRTLVMAGASKWLALAAAILAVTTAAFVIAVFLEPPLRRMLGRAIEFTPRRRPAASST